MICGFGAYACATRADIEHSLNVLSGNTEIEELASSELLWGAKFNRDPSFSKLMISMFEVTYAPDVKLVIAGGLSLLETEIDKKFRIEIDANLVDSKFSIAPSFGNLLEDFEARVRADFPLPALDLNTLWQQS
jgi:hypothetical protein